MTAALVLRGLAQRRLRTFLTGLAVLLGVAMIAGTYVQTDQIDSAFKNIEATAYAGNDVVVSPRQAFTSSIGAPAPFNAALVQRVAAVPGVARAEGSLYESGSLVRHGKTVGSRYAPGIVMADQQAPFDPMRYVAGGKPQPGEVSVNTKLAADEGLHVGDQLEVATRSGVQSARLAGVFKYGDVSSVGGATIIVAPYDDVARWYDAVGQVTGISVAARAGVSPRTLAQRVRAVLPHALVARTGEQEAAKQAKDINDAIGKFLKPMLLSLAGAALLVGGFIIFNTFSITVAQRAREFALLRAIGATRRQIVLAVTGEALLLGGVASVLGIVAGLGIALGIGALFDAAGAGIPRSGLVVEPRTVVVSLAVGVLVTLAAALLPAVRATRVPPVAALTGAPPPSPRARRWAPWIAALTCVAGLAALLTGLFSDAAATTRMSGMASGAVLLFVGIALSARWFVRPVAAVIGFPVERLFGLPGRLARENAMRNPARTATTSASLMVGLALVVFVAVFAAGLKASVNTSIGDLFTADYVVSTKGVEPLPAGAGRAIANTPGVRATAPIMFDQVSVNGGRVNGTTDTVEGVDPAVIGKVYRPKWITGSDATLRALGPGQALIEQQFAKAHHLRVGGRFTLRTATGRPERLRAVGEYDDPQMLQGTMVTTQQFRRLSTLRDPFLYLVTQDPAASAATVHRSLEATLTAYPAAEVKSNAEYRQDVSDQLDQMVNILYALLAMSVLISLFGIANSLFLSVHERTREFGLLRAVGATGPQVKRVVRYESVITAVIGGLLGIGAGLFFAWLITEALRDLGFGFSVPAGQLVAFLVLAVLVGVVGGAAPARRGAHIDVLAALRHE